MNAQELQLSQKDNLIQSLQEEQNQQDQIKFSPNEIKNYNMEIKSNHSFVGDDDSFLDDLKIEKVIKNSAPTIEDAYHLKSEKEQCEQQYNQVKQQMFVQSQKFEQEVLLHSNPRFFLFLQLFLFSPYSN